MTREQAMQLRALIEKAAANLNDADALVGAVLFEAWAPERDYGKGQRVRYGGRLYRLIPEPHHARSCWSLGVVPASWARIDDPAEEWPDWVRPLGAEDAYPAGAKVSYNEKRWINTHGDGNVWEPGVYGWSEAAN